MLLNILWCIAAITALVLIVKFTIGCLRRLVFLSLLAFALVFMFEPTWLGALYQYLTTLVS